MSKVALRVYNHEIESLIDQGHLDEAVAHCQHILKTFPKHLETYRLLGKAYLELHRYPDAVDIFQRVLLAVPDDFVSHLGMSIAFDEQKDLDGALWHMERAFESNPSNGGVQAELRRLYGRRDGLEPPKIRLTRGALAQMYLKGGQYPQAITEIKAVLAEDASRADMKTLQARVYFRAGQKLEATELCTDLLRQYPYCLDANRILAEILPGTSLAQSVELYRKRVQALDPYAAFVTTSIFESDSVQDAAVTLEKLNLDETPGWQESAAPQTSAQPEAPLPEFLTQSGWGPSTGEFKEGPVDFDSPAEPGPELAAAEIPDWLKAMAPPAAAQENQPAADAPVSNTDLDWLSGLGATPAAEPNPAQPSGEPDWLNAISPTAAAVETPDWLQNIGQPAAEETPAPAEEIPAAENADLPDWLSGLSAPAAEETPLPTAESPAAADDLSALVTSGPGVAAEDQDAAFKWLESLAAGQGAKAEELLTNPEERLDQAPGWVGQVNDTPPQPAAEAPAPYQPEKPIEPEESVIGDLSAPVTSGPGVGAEDQDAAFKWLESLAAGQGAKAEELLTSPEERLDQAPDWLGAVSNPPTPLSAPVTAEPGVGAEDQESAFKWLENLAAGQGAKAEELLTSPEERLDQAPSWVDKVPAEPQAELPADNEQESDDWLSGLAAATGLPQSGEAQPAAESPDWMQELPPLSSAPDREEPESQPAENIAAEDSPDWLSEMDQPISGSGLLAEELPDWLRDESADERPPMQQPVSDWIPAAQESLPPETAFTEKTTQPLAELPPELPAADEITLPAEFSISAETPAADAEFALPAEFSISAETPAADAALPSDSAGGDWFSESQPAAEAPTVPPATSQPAAPPPPARPVLRQTGALGLDKDSQALQRARVLMDKGGLDGAMSEYAKLVKRGKLTEEVIYDLMDATYRHPVDVIVWQTLGDAYMRANRLQEALDAYTKAEELLR